MYTYMLYVFMYLYESAKPLITALAEAGFQPGTTGFWNRDITFRPPGQFDPRMGTGSATISILRTEASNTTYICVYKSTYTR